MSWAPILNPHSANFTRFFTLTIQHPKLLKQVCQPSHQHGRPRLAKGWLHPQLGPLRHKQRPVVVRCGESRTSGVKTQLQTHEGISKRNAGEARCRQTGRLTAVTSIAPGKSCRSLGRKVWTSAAQPTPQHDGPIAFWRIHSDPCWKPPGGL